MLLSELEFGSYLTYTPRPNTESGRKSKNIMYWLKKEQFLTNPPKLMSSFVVDSIKNDIESLPFKDFFDEDVFLVPIPRSSPIKAGSLWVPDVIAKKMSEAGFGTYCNCLTRVKSLPKSAYAEQGKRPKVIDHFNSIECNLSIHRPTKIVLIDDVITRGSTLIGCASKIKEILPDSSIKAFAVLRTISKTENFLKIKDACIGVIDNNRANGPFRNP